MEAVRFWSADGGNTVVSGDNLPILRSLPSESFRLIYLDPPFNSNASYNVLFKGPTGSDSSAQIEAFDDTWHWNDSAEAAFADVLRSGNGAAAEMLPLSAMLTKLRNRARFENIVIRNVYNQYD